MYAICGLVSPICDHDSNLRRGVIAAQLHTTPAAARSFSSFRTKMLLQLGAILDRCGASLAYPVTVLSPPSPPPPPLNHTLVQQLLERESVVVRNASSVRARATKHAVTRSGIIPLEISAKNCMQTTGPPIQSMAEVA